VRVGVIDNPGSSRSGLEDTRVYRALWSALLTQKNKVALEFTQTLLKGATQDLLKGGAKMKDLLLQVTSGQRHPVEWRALRCCTSYILISDVLSPYKTSRTVECGT
jgi:hypothetical protein